MSPSGRSAAPPRTRVLIIDDVEDTRNIYATFLQHRGFEALVAADANAAWAVAGERPPHVIVMDYSLPGIDGLSATRTFKAHSKTARIPIIILTGHTLTITTRAAREAGAVALLTKPCVPEALEAEIRRVLAEPSEFRYVRGTEG
jgi:DNA-binding response OmpR family regulator